jgi:acylphosphatase
MTGSGSDLASLHAIVHGRVQGVFFRAFVEEHGHALGLTGSVRNVRQPAAVEVHAEGERPALERLLEELHRGPAGSRVERVEASWGVYEGRFAGFGIVY